MSEMTVEQFVGISIAKDTVDVCIGADAEVMHVAYDHQGVATICQRLKAVSPTLIVMEATGGLETRLASELAALGLSVAVIQPSPGPRFCQGDGPTGEDRPGRRLPGEFRPSHSAPGSRHEGCRYSRTGRLGQSPSAID